MKKFTLANGDQWNAIGLGTWKSRPGEVENAVYEAIKVGYRHIDCAYIYMNEKEIGNGLKKAFDENLVKREDLWITSKLWNNSHKRQDVVPAIQKTLNDLQLDYLDLYIIHWPVVNKPDVINATTPEDYLTLNEVPIIETWQGMEEVKEKGLAKHIGVSNFSIKKLDKLYNEATKFKPEVNQVELHPYLQQPELVSFCHSKNILLTAYSPLGSGDRSDRMKKDNEPSLLQNNTITEIAKKHNATAGQVLIAWHLHRGNTVIPKSTNPSRIKENFEAKDLNLDQDDLEKIKALDKHYRYVDAKFFEIPGNGYVNIYDE